MLSPPKNKDVLQTQGDQTATGRKTTRSTPQHPEPSTPEAQRLVPGDRRGATEGAGAAPTPAQGAVSKKAVRFWRWRVAWGPFGLREVFCSQWRPGELGGRVANSWDQNGRSLHERTEVRTVNVLSNHDFPISGHVRDMILAEGCDGLWKVLWNEFWEL